MNYNSYQKSRNLAWEILIREEVSELPVSIVALCRKMGIEVKQYTPIDANDGMCVILDGVPKIFVNKNCTVQRKRFTVAHELGHILLGHIGKYELVNREPSGNDNPIEQEANVFASRLLAPACVLWGCNVRTAEHIMKLCDISKPAAEFRMKRMQELYKRNMFLTLEQEQQVYNQFLEFIKTHQHQDN